MKVSLITFIFCIFCFCCSQDRDCWSCLRQRNAYQLESLFVCFYSTFSCCKKQFQHHHAMHDRQNFFFIYNTSSSTLSLPGDESRKCFQQIDPRGFSLLHEQRVNLKDDVYVYTCIVCNAWQAKSSMPFTSFYCPALSFWSWVGGWLRPDNIIWVCM